MLSLRVPRNRHRNQRGHEEHGREQSHPRNFLVSDTPGADQRQQAREAQPPIYHGSWRSPSEKGTAKAPWRGENRKTTEK